MAAVGTHNGGGGKRGPLCVICTIYLWAMPPNGFPTFLQGFVAVVFPFWPLPCAGVRDCRPSLVAGPSGPPVSASRLCFNCRIKPQAILAGVWASRDGTPQTKNM